MSKQALLEKLADKTYRDAFISDGIDVGLPMQLRSMREGRGWNQSYVAEQTHTKQPRFSLMERPGYGNFTLKTLKKLASLFEVGLIVSFVPFSEMIEFTEAFSPKRLAIPEFSVEYARLQRRYSGTQTEIQQTTQGILNFAGGTSAPTSHTQPVKQVPVIIASKSTFSEINIPTQYAGQGRSTPGANTHYGYAA